MDNNNTLTDQDLRGLYNTANFFGDYQTITFYYASKNTIKKGGSIIMVVGENPYSIDVGVVPFMLIIMGGILIIYSLITCIRCCLRKGVVPWRLIKEYEKREWEKDAKNRMMSILSECPKSEISPQNNTFHQNECTICLRDFKENLMIRKLGCSHIFHAECIEGWIEAKINDVPKCPICNVELTDQRPPGTVPVRETQTNIEGMDFSFDDDVR